MWQFLWILWGTFAIELFSASRVGSNLFLITFGHKNGFKSISNHIWSQEWIQIDFWSHLVPRMGSHWFLVTFGHKNGFTLISGRIWSQEWVQIDFWWHLVTTMDSNWFLIAFHHKNGFKSILIVFDHQNGFKLISNPIWIQSWVQIDCWPQLVTRMSSKRFLTIFDHRNGFKSSWRRGSAHRSERPWHVSDWVTKCD